jgi:hypothetical protein
MKEYLKKYMSLIWRTLSIPLLIIFLNLTLIMSGCSSSNGTKYENESNPEKAEIISAAKIEQENEMYSTKSDSVYLYWLEYPITGLKNISKCNIFALNCLFKAGYECPGKYTLTHDLMDIDKYNDVFPVIEISSPENISVGDLVVWDGHVIIFESLVLIKDDYYAKGIWGGSKKEDDGKNIKNNVAYGKYKLEGNYIVRRPRKK